MTLTYNSNPKCFEQLKQFSSVKEFNKNLEMWLADHARTFGKKELIAIKKLSKFGAVVPGITTLKLNTLKLNIFEKIKMDINIRTIKRAIKKAASIGIIKIYDTKMPNTNLNGASIHVFQKYRNVTAGNESVEGTKAGKESHKDADKLPSYEIQYTSGSAGKMSPHKTITNKAINIKNHKTMFMRVRARKTLAYKSINHCMMIKNDKIELLTNPVKDYRPLSFFNRLKNVVYKSAFNTRQMVTSIKNMIYKKVNDYCVFGVWESHRHKLLDRALNVVAHVLDGHKDGKLGKIQNMAGFIKTCVQNEINAYIEREISKQLATNTTGSSYVYDLYSAELDREKADRQKRLDDFLAMC